MQALGCENLPKIDENDQFHKKGGVRGVKKLRLKAVVVDIQSHEEFHLDHLPHSISLPENYAFQADGSLNLFQSALTLGTMPKGHVIVVVGGKKEVEPVVSSFYACIDASLCSLWRCGCPKNSWTAHFSP